MGKKFCIAVCLIQCIIAALFYVIAFTRGLGIDRSVIDILGGVSWTMTSMWWAWSALESDK